MELATFFGSILGAIEQVGYITFFVLIAFSILLWRLHPILGILGIALVFGYLFGFIG